MSKYISDKIKILSFVCIILVLYIHSGFSNEVLILNEKKNRNADNLYSPIYHIWNGWSNCCTFILYYFWILIFLKCTSRNAIYI